MTQTSKLPKIKIATVAGKKTYIPLKHAVNATQRVGKITPYMTRFMDANAKVKINLETLEYNAPMVSPTVGDVYLKHWIYFVGLDKLSHDFVEMFTKQTNVGIYGREFVHTKVPRMRLSELTMLCMTGAFCTIYFGFNPTTYMLVDSDSAEYHRFWHLFDQHVNQKGQEPGTVKMWTGSPYYEPQNALIHRIRTTQILDMQAACINAGVLRPDVAFEDAFGSLGEDAQGQLIRTNQTLIPLSNPAIESFFNWVQPSPDGNGYNPVWNNPSASVYTHGLDCSPVPIDTNDYSVVRKFSYLENDEEKSFYMKFCFRFSDFGRALRDLLVSGGYQLNIASDKMVSMLPLFAEHLAYFECQSLQMYKNWKNTACYRLIRDWELNENEDDSDYTSLMSYNAWSYNERPLLRSFFEFIRDLASQWAISPQDFVSAHTRTQSVSAMTFNNLDSFIHGISDNVASQQGDPAEVPIQASSTKYEPSINSSGTDDRFENTLPYINKINHDMVTAELLRKLTLRMNVNTMLGRKTIALAKEQGFGDWVDLQKASLIDYGEMKLDLKPTISTADTSTADGKGADLGQYGGRGYGHKTHKPKTYKNAVPGYYIILTTFYVDSGYSQACDAYNYQVDVDDFYKREFDAVGYELDEKNQVFGALNHVEDGDMGKLDEAFGFIPRDTKYKVISNKLLGSFASGELEDIYSTYHLEKLMPIGTRKTVSSHTMIMGTDNNHNLTTYTLSDRITPAQLPIAGNVWRFVGRYPWLGLYERIFKLQEYDIRKTSVLLGLEGDDFIDVATKYYTFFALSPENYTVLNGIYFDSWQDKKPIAESFGTLSQIFEGFANAAVKKE